MQWIPESAGYSYVNVAHVATIETEPERDDRGEMTGLYLVMLYDPLGYPIWPHVGPCTKEEAKAALDNLMGKLND